MRISITYISRTSLLSMGVGAALLAPIAAPAPAQAGPKLELGATIGGHRFADDTELGAMDERPDHPGVSPGGMLGARLGLAFGKRLAAEVETMLIPTKDDVLGKTATVIGLRGHARFDILTGKLRPFVVAGYGAQVLRSSSMQLINDTDQAFHAGVGVRYAVTRALDLRLDLRELLVPGRTEKIASDYEVSTGLTWRFGQAAPKAAPRPLPVEPEPAVAVPTDKDGDGIWDTDDNCVNEAEDVDNYKDADGCPDNDNDGDKIADAKDACPNVAETVNGFTDDDGCPDEVIEELTGINFYPNSARFDETGTVLLDRAYAILAKNERLRVEIAGHTSAEGSAKANMALSLARAEAVRDYLIKRGIAPERLRAQGYGADQPQGDNETVDGRIKNRRIEFRILKGE